MAKLYNPDLLFSIELTILKFSFLLLLTLFLHTASISVWKNIQILLTQEVVMLWYIISNCPILLSYHLSAPFIMPNLNFSYFCEFYKFITKYTNNLKKKYLTLCYLHYKIKWIMRKYILLALFSELLSWQLSVIFSKTKKHTEV